jgi:hypothetical protein
MELRGGLGHPPKTAGGGLECGRALARTWCAELDANRDIAHGRPPPAASPARSSAKVRTDWPGPPRSSESPPARHADLVTADTPWMTARAPEPAWIHRDPGRVRAWGAPRPTAAQSSHYPGADLSRVAERAGRHVAESSVDVHPGMRRPDHGQGACIASAAVDVCERQRPVVE